MAKLDDADVDMCFHVGRDKDTLYEGVFGWDVLNTVTATIGANGVVFHVVHPVDLGPMLQAIKARLKPSRNKNTPHR